MVRCSRSRRVFYFSWASYAVESAFPTFVCYFSLRIINWLKYCTWFRYNICTSSPKANPLKLNQINYSYFFFHFSISSLHVTPKLYPSVILVLVCHIYQQIELCNFDERATEYKRPILCVKSYLILHSVLSHPTVALQNSQCTANGILYCLLATVTISSLSRTLHTVHSLFSTLRAFNSISRIVSWLVLRGV